MGKRGPKPTPTAVKRRRGSWRAEYDNPKEPKPTRGVPRCPPYLSPKAKTAWKRISKLVDAMGVMTLADENALARYCETYSLWRDTVRSVQKAGRLVPVLKWNRVTEEFVEVGVEHNPDLALLLKVQKQLLEHEREFGLTPSARTRIEVEEDSSDEISSGPSRPRHDVAKGPRLATGGAG